MNRNVFVWLGVLSLKLSLYGQTNFIVSNQTLQERNQHSAVPVGIADMNGDGMDDIVTLDNGHVLYIQYQTPGPDRPFVRYEVSSNVDVAEQNDICIADFDNDGTNDLMICGSYDKVKMYYGNKNSYAHTLKTVTNLSFFSQGASSGDFNQDGWVDVVLLNDNAANFTLINDGAGNLVKTDYFDFITVPVSDNSGNYGSVYTDFDMDGDLDFYIAKCRQGVNDPADPRRIDMLFVNDGTGHYTQNAKAYGLDDGHQTWTADFGDFDNDGDLDLFKTQHDVICELYENINNDTFINITPTTGIDIQGVPLQGMFTDLDNDGYLDILVSGDRVEYYHNNGDKTFTKEIPFDPYIFGTFALGDLNHDGFTDVYASRVIPFNNPDPIREDLLFINQTNSNHFLALDLENAPGKNQSAIGAMALLYGPWGVQIREVRGGEEYGISNSHHLIFGLGSSTTYDSLVIRWPDKTRESFNGLEVDQYWKLKYGGCQYKPIKMFDDLHVLCGQDSIVLQNTSAYAAEQWSNGETTDSIVVKSPGLYYLNLTDDNHCTVRTLPIEVTTDPDTIKPTLYFEGNTTLCNGEIGEITVSEGQSYLWSSGETTQVIEATTSGAYYARVHGYCSDQNSDTLLLNFIVPAAPTATGDSIELGESALLQAQGDSIVWYADPYGIDIIGTGSTLTLDSLKNTTLVYAANLNPLAGVDYLVGPTSQAGNTKYNATFVNGGLLFDVYKPVVLNQVTAFTDSVGERIIEISDGGAFLFQKTVNLVPGTNIIDLNVDLPVGSYTMGTNTDHNIQVFNGAASPYLWRSSDGVDFPYEVPGVLSITNSTYGNSFYYYFYDWKFATQDQYCSSELVPVTAVVDPGSAVQPVDQGSNTIRVFPNPTDHAITIQVTQSGPVDIQLYSLDGQLVLQHRDIGVQHDLVELNLNGLRPAIYMVKMIQNQKTYFGKVVKL